jgi:ATP-dependent RNA helicase DDX3X
MSDWETAPAALSLEDKRHVANSGVPAVESGNVETIKPSGADEYAAKARDAGWVKPMSYNYDAYAKGNTYERTKLSRDENVDPNCDVPFRGAGGDAGFTDELTSWGASAAKYEWKDDYGDVGPDVPELRQQLFNSEFTQRPGNNMAALVELKVTVESEAQVQPMKRVSYAQP